MFREHEIKRISGWLISVVLLAVLIGSIWSLNSAVTDLDVTRILGSVLVLILTIGAFFGLTVVNPNEARELYSCSVDTKALSKNRDSGGSIR